MEEAVWDEIINPSSPLTDDPGHRLSRPRPSAVIFQDFLGPPFNNGMQRINAFSPAPPTLSATSGPSSLTALSLTAGINFPMHGGGGGHLGNGSSLNPASFNASPFEAALANPGGSPVGFACFGSKRPVPNSDETSSGGGDRRHKRMIKNRESAARSRARKQAYTNELEIEVAHLVEENAKLRRQQEQYHIALVAQQTQAKHKLQRSSTAPF